MLQINLIVKWFLQVVTQFKGYIAQWLSKLSAHLIKHHDCQWLEYDPQRTMIQCVVALKCDRELIDLIKEGYDIIQSEPL
jgi:hypothetical protein